MCDNLLSLHCFFIIFYIFFFATLTSSFGLFHSKNMNFLQFLFCLFRASFKCNYTLWDKRAENLSLWHKRNPWNIRMTLNNTSCALIIICVVFQNVFLSITNNKRKRRTKRRHKHSHKNTNQKVKFYCFQVCFFIKWNMWFFSLQKFWYLFRCFFTVVRLMTLRFSAENEDFSSIFRCQSQNQKKKAFCLMYFREF